jgi:hypothetical protein
MRANHHATRQMRVAQANASMVETPNTPQHQSARQTRANKPIMDQYYRIITTMVIDDDGDT